MCNIISDYQKLISEATIILVSMLSYEFLNIDVYDVGTILSFEPLHHHPSKNQHRD